MLPVNEICCWGTAYGSRDMKLLNEAPEPVTDQAGWNVGDKAYCAITRAKVESKSCNFSLVGPVGPVAPVGPV